MNKNIIIVLLSIAVVILLAIVISDKVKPSAEQVLKSQYDEIKDKGIMEMTEIEWSIRNRYEALQSQKNNLPTDTLSYQQARMQEETSQLLLAINNPCGETKLIEAFHEIMKFNMPYERYKPEAINVQPSGDCSIRINVTTKEPKYGWKTFWVFEIVFDASLGKHVLNTIKRDFLG